MSDEHLQLDAGLKVCPFCKKLPGTKAGPPAMARCVTPGCEGTKLAASLITEWNTRPHTDAGALLKLAGLAVANLRAPDPSLASTPYIIRERLAEIIEKLAASQGSAGGEKQASDAPVWYAHAEAHAWADGYNAAPKLTAAGTSLQNLQTSPTEQEYLADNIATVAWHLGRPGARMRVDNDMCGLAVDPGEVLKEVSRRLTTPAQEAKPCDVAALDQAWDEINALGGSKMYASGYDLGICDTVERALEIIEALGGMDPKQRPASSVPSADREAGK